MKFLFRFFAFHILTIIIIVEIWYIIASIIVSWIIIIVPWLSNNLLNFNSIRSIKSIRKWVDLENLDDTVDKCDLLLSNKSVNDRVKETIGKNDHKNKGIPILILQHVSLISQYLNTIEKKMVPIDSN